MGIFEIISAIVLIVACVFIVIVVLMKDTKTNMSQAISGASSDNFFQKNAGRTKEAKLNKATVAATVIFFVLALAVNVINVHFGGSNQDMSSSGTGSSIVVDPSGVTGLPESGSTAPDTSAADSTGTDGASSAPSSAPSTVSE